MAGLVLAAGAGRRFGTPKLLADLRGRPLVEYVLAAMAGSPLDRVTVVLGAASGELLARIDLHGAVPVICPDWAEGQAASLRSGIRAVGEADAVVVALGDQPNLAPAAVEAVLAARDGRAEAVRAMYSGSPGHPVVLERSLFPRVAELRGDVGARELLEEVRVAEVDCDGLGNPADVDTRDDLEALR